MAVRDKYDTRKTGERARKPDDVGTEGLSYERQRSPSERTRLYLQDTIALDVLEQAFFSLQCLTAGTFAGDVVRRFVATWHELKTYQPYFGWAESKRLQIAYQHYLKNGGAKYDKAMREPLPRGMMRE